MHIFLISLGIYIAGMIGTMLYAWKQSGPTDTFMEQLPAGVIWPFFLLMIMLWHD